MWDNYLNKKVEVREKIYDGYGSSMPGMGVYNKTIGILTNVYGGEYIELDNKILISIDYIYKIEIKD